MRMVAFLGGVAVIFVLAFGAGRFFDDGPAAAEHAHGGTYELVPADVDAHADAGPFRFTITDEHGAVVTDFAERHEKRLHLIAVDTGFSGYQHLHPTMAADGTWSVSLERIPGAMRLYADFKPTGGADAVATTTLQVPGAVGSPAYSLLRSVQVDGYTVTVLGDLEAGRSAGLRFEVGRNGVPVTDLEPYLAAYGHLVMLRASDGSYQHVHPEDGPAGPVGFAAEAPTAATYHLYFDFKHRGVVRTVHFVLDAAAVDDAGQEEGGHGDH